LVVDEKQPEASSPPPASKRSGLLKRLPFFAFLAVGLWLWKGGLFPQERELVWTLGDERATVRKLEIQLWDDEGRLLKREELFFPQGAAPAQVTQKVSLKEGHYTARIFVQREGGGESPEARVRELEIGDREAYGLTIPDRG